MLVRLIVCFGAFHDVGDVRREERFVGDVVGVDPEGMRALAGVMDGVAEELGDIGAEIAAALSSVGQASWAAAEVAMVAAWVEVEAHDVRMRAATVDADQVWQALPIGAPLLSFDDGAFGWSGMGEAALDLGARRHEAAAMLGEIDALPRRGGRLPRYLEQHRRSLAGAVAALDAALDGRVSLPKAKGAGGGAGSVLAGAVAGDLSGDTSLEAVAGQTAIGFVPIAGQVADVRDISAALARRQYGRLPLLAVAFIPSFDWVKGGFKLGRAAARQIIEEGLSETAADGIEVLARRIGADAAELAARRVVILQVYKQECIIRLNAILRKGELDRATLRKVRKARNALRDHLSDKDLVGAVRDTAGVPVRKGAEVFDHLNEIRGTTKSLTKSVERLTAHLRPAVSWTDAGSDLSRDVEWLTTTRVELERLLPEARRPGK